jgi:ATP-dependent DNA ligase
VELGGQDAPGTRGRQPLEPPQKDLSFVPPRLQRVVEARYDSLKGARFRHPPQFVRWRPDRDPGSCGFAQLDRPARFAVPDVLAGRLSGSRRAFDLARGSDRQISTD